MSSHVKILFEVSFEGSKVVEFESVWALPSGNGYKLDNIPFYAKGIAYGDVVAAVETEGMLLFDGLLEPSNHSTVRIWFADAVDVGDTRKTLEAMGCSSEVSDRPRLVAVDIPPSVSYEEVKAYLDEGEANGRWDFEEACLGFQ